MVFTEHYKKELAEELNGIFSELTTAKSEQENPKINGIIAGVTTEQENVYLDSRGFNNLDTREKILTDNVVSFFSCTKSITAMGLLKLYEKRIVELDIPAKTYLPLLAEIGVVEEGLIDRKTGDFIKVPQKPATDVTLRHLLTHTTGFCYPFLSDDYSALATKDPKNNILDPSVSYFTNEKVPLLHEPGTKWTYGHSFDWIGLIIEKVTGQKLGDYLKESIFDPAGMDSCTFHLENLDNLVKLHMVDKKTKNAKKMKNGLPLETQIDLGGQGCFGTVGDFLKFIRIWLNDGYCVDTGNQILRPETVIYATKNHLPPGVRMEFEGMNLIPKDYEPDGFTLTGCAYSMNKLPTGMPKGAIYWFGYANLYFWIDLEAKIGGFMATQLLPLFNRTAIMAFARMEFNVYEALNESKEQSSSSKL